MSKPNHAAQVQAMAKLAGDQWRPSELAGFRVGDAVRLPNIECTLKVVGLNPPALLTLEAPTGRRLQAGWRVVKHAANFKRKAS